MTRYRFVSNPDVVIDEDEHGHRFSYDQFGPGNHFGYAIVATPMVSFLRDAGIIEEIPETVTLRVLRTTAEWHARRHPVDYPGGVLTDRELAHNDIIDAARKTLGGES